MTTSSEPSRPLRVGIAGCGSTRQLYRDIRDAKGAWDLVAIADPDASNLRAGRDLWNCPSAYAASGAMLDEAHLDVLIVGTPPSTHCDLVVASARRGVHVLVQKPLATTVDEVRLMREACAEHGISMGVSLYRRFTPAFQAMADAISRLELGGTLRVTWCSRSGLSPRTSKLWKEQAHTRGGVLVDLGTHVIDAAEWWLGDVIGGQLAMTVGPYGELDNTAAFLLYHRNNSSSLCYLSNIEAVAEETYEYTTSRGGVRLSRIEEGFPGTWTLTTTKSDASRQSVVFDAPPRNPLIAELDFFVDRLSRLEIDPEDRGTRAVDITTRLYESSIASRDWPRAETSGSLSRVLGARSQDPTRR